MIKDLVQTGMTYAATIGLTGIVAPAASIAATVSDSKRADWWIQQWAKGLLASAGVELVTHGLENIPTGNCVFAANHQSNFDPPALYAVLPKHARFVAKAELFRIPVFGPAMRRVGMVKVDRRGTASDRGALSEAAQAVRDRVSLIFYPEGTRSPDGVLRPFKKGAAILAIEAGAPVVPVAIAGTKDIMPKGSKLVHGGRVVVIEFGEPIPTTGLTVDARDELTQRMYDAVKALLEKGEAEVRERQR